MSNHIAILFKMTARTCEMYINYNISAAKHDRDINEVSFPRFSSMGNPFKILLWTENVTLM